VNNQRRLGRGLEALLGRAPEGEGAMPAEGAAPVTPSPEQSGGPTWIPLGLIDHNPYQPRKVFDEAELAELAESIQQHGMLQPIVVRKLGERYQLVSGERRLRAITSHSWEKAPCHVWEVEDRKMAELALVENIQRKDLNPLEKAASFQRYIQEYQCTQEELAARVNVDRSTVANLIRLLELPEPVQTAVRNKSITQGHARALLPLGDEREQVNFANRIELESLSVRATEELVQTLIRELDADPLGVVDSDGTQKKTPAQTRSEHIASMEQELRNRLGAKVEIKQSAKGKGKIVIHFATHEEFDRLRGELNPAATAQREAG